MSAKNFHVVLQSRPGADAEPTDDNFRYEECPMPNNELHKEEILVKTCYLSVDPAMRCLMNEDSGVNYLKAWKLNEAIIGTMGVGVVIKSNHSDFVPGDLVYGTLGWPWQMYFIKNMTNCGPYWQKVDKNLAASPSLSIHLLTGLTALLGIWEKGHIKPTGSQTFVVSGAAGACGSLAGQIAQLEGCTTVVGICGSEEKCEWLMKDLGFNAAINYKADDIPKKLEEYCPGGVDAYFDNVGGPISDQVIGKMNTNSHVILCGQISQYNMDLPYPPPIPEDTAKIIKDRFITRDRFTVINHLDRFEEAGKQFTEWVMSGKLKIRETVSEGLETTGSAFVSMMKGGNIGKQLVHVSDP